MRSEARVTGVFPTPTCGAKPLGQVPPDFAGIIGFGVHSGLGTADNIARQVKQANISYVRVFANWSMIELAAGASYDWTDRDNIIGAFLDAGDEVILTVGYPPAWRSSGPPGDPAPSAYPPADLAQWDAYVRAVVERYGDRVHNWQFWNEPDLLQGFKVYNDSRPREVAYVDLLNRTASLIRSIDPSAKIWGPDVISSTQDAERFATEALTRGDLDHFTIHTFQTTVDAMVPELERFRVLAQVLRPGMTVSVTAAQVLAAAPRRLACPFVGVPELEHARIVQDIYACLGNAGARHVFMYKTNDRILASCRTYADGTPDPSNPDGYELNGILGPHPLGSFAEAIGQCVISDCSQLEHRKKPAYWAVSAVSAHARGQ